MITKCRFCDYQSVDEPLSIPILEVLTEKDMPQEDYVLWMKRLLKGLSLKSYSGVKIHMGRMHKDEAYYMMSPDHIFNKAEKKALEEWR